MAKSDDFEALFNETLTRELPQEGDIVTGRVIAVTKDIVLVDFNYKQEGQISIAEFRLPGGEVSVKVGDEVEAYLESIENDEGIAVLSKEKAAALKIWDQLQAALDDDRLVDGTVIGKVRGGFSVDIGVKAFLPASQIDFKGPGGLDRLMGRRLKFKILKLNKRRGSIIVSRRAMTDRDRDLSRHGVLQNLAEGQVISGVVKNLTEYGAFVDLGGVDGLLHITDMSWGRLGHPSEVVAVGQEVPVKILKVDAESGKVSLGLKQLKADPWKGVAEKYPAGTRIHGRVVNLADYGAFVSLEEGVEGLVHVSEMSWKKVKHPSKLLAAGQEVDVVVLDLDPVARRISLGIKQLGKNPWDEVGEKCPVGSKIQGPVRSVTDFGVFVGLTPEIDGLIHLSDLYWVRPARPLGEIFRKGKEVEAIVLSLDRGGERISLGVKQLKEDPWPRLRKDYSIGKKCLGKVVWIGERGIAVELEEGVEGFVDREESWKPEIGSTVKIVVRSLEERDRRILLGPVLEEGKK